MIEIKLLSSPTCVPCTIFAKKLDMAGIKYEKINALDHPEYGIQSTPHIIITKDGVEIKNEYVGSVNEMLRYIQKLQ